MPHRREEFMTRCRRALEENGRPYVLLSGDWKTRFETAVTAIDRLLAAPLDEVPVAAQPRITAELAVAR
jgi:nicotinamide riboside kinase